MEIHDSNLSSVAGFGLWYGHSTDIDPLPATLSSPQSCCSHLPSFFAGSSTVGPLLSSGAVFYRPAAHLSLASMRPERCAMVVQ